MSNQNRFLLPHQPSSLGNANQSASTSGGKGGSSPNAGGFENENQVSVDDNFDSYWEEEARNPHRNRIRIGRQYQATVPQLLKSGEKDQRQLEDLETLSFCPKRSAKVSNAELDHYFTVAKSLNLFASLVETRSLLGRDVTIADLNRIRHKEGLSLASVIQPNRHSNNNYNSNISPQSSQQANSASVTSSGEQKSPTCASDNLSTSISADNTKATDQSVHDTYTPNLALMRALSHFISLHHPCHHDNDCKKLLKDIPLEDEQEPVVSIKSGNLRGQSSSSSQNPLKESKPSRSRSSAKQQSLAVTKSDESDVTNEQDQAQSDINQSAPYYDWTREEIQLFSKAIEVCGKNFGSIKKEFLPSKSVKSIVEYYYIGSRETSESKKKSNHSADSTDGCSSIEKSQANNNGGGGSGGNGSGGGGGYTSPGSKSASNSNSSDNNATGPSSNSGNGTSNNSKSIPDATGEADKNSHSLNKGASGKTNLSSRQPKIEDSSSIKQKAKNIDARMSVYNFDDEMREENSPVSECPCPGAEVKPLKAKPILPNTPAGGEAGNSNVGSLKFFMDGQLVLKLNACQEQQKCHWVQSGDKIPTSNQRNKRYSKRTSDRTTESISQNGSHTESINEDDLKTEDLSADEEDSKESANSFTNITTPRQNSFSASPSPKRSRIKTEPNPPANQAQMPSPIDYNRLAVTNMKERNDNLNNNLNNNNILNNPMMNPWLQANNITMAGLFSLFPAGNLVNAGSLVNNQVPTSAPNIVNMTTRPMDLSRSQLSQHSHSQKPMQTTTKPTSRSKSKQKHG